MVFKFLRYIKPIWYFNLKPFRDFSYFPLEETLKKQGFSLDRDLGYKNLEAQNLDLAWRAFQVGFISNSEEEGIDVWKKTELPIQDEYRFLRKNFHKAWNVYVLFIRLITLKNPFNEIAGFLKSRKVKREDYSKNSIEYKEYEAFDSELIQEKPMISVIIPTLNRYEYLKDVFKDLENQTYKNFEVIVVDQTDDFRADFYEGWNLDLHYWFQEEKALWKARNEAIKFSKGEYVLLYDDDSLVENNWIEEHLKTLDFFKADLSSGVSISLVGAQVPLHYSYFRWSDQLDTGNVLIKKSIFKAIGLFDRQFEKQRMGDGEFGLRAYLAGYKNISNPKAKRIHLKVSQGGLRQMGSWDELRPKKIFASRPIPSVLYLFRKYFGNKNAFQEGIKMASYSFIPYKYKGDSKKRVFFMLITLLVFPLVIYTFSKSWSKSSKMLNSKKYANELFDI
ncbi:glycosyltransferase involved in cell wall biosynthesis [Flavobacterium arsenatis]|uniref:Glycosyltransferase involved in cell wall biosynthesis n=1 Tax=Flavobacterium arsenatis TaxID=1484332 RepID=A0ABU1TM02_9FLAO|nr:glycosyltransferase family A protein [Flavobacterium arsenatis]MDR6966999.1 glycosyltransferase involved in cell wall biosynthesis [Flavobacterium arsenatis]